MTLVKAIHGRQCWKNLSQKFWLHQKIRREISGGVFRAIFDLRPHPVADIVNFEPFVTRVTDMDATVKLTTHDFFFPMSWNDMKLEK